mmetsp:Transcript_27486/g.79101  ORF Transcript_27486/g.79101 Transcript_27486/m.79101 type:complete len:129 (+) Transcript_27486:259-645(+)
MPKEGKTFSLRRTIIAGRHSIMLQWWANLQLRLSCSSGAAVLCSTSKADWEGPRGTWRSTTGRSETSCRNTQMDVFEAVKANDVQSVHRLIDVQGKDILDSQDDEFPWKRTPFIAAVQYGHVGIMKVM